MIFAILLSGIFAVLMVRLYLNPIKSLKWIVEGMSASRSSRRWKKKGNDEFDELGTAFNSMADSLLNYQKQLEALISLRLSELEEARRQAAFGSMMAAGIAHDIKGPLGSVNTALTFIEDQLKSVDTAYRDDSLKSSDLKSFLEKTAEGLGIALSSLKKAIDLARSFKDVVADQVKGEVRSIVLQPYIDDVVMSYRPRLRKSGVTVECDIPGDLTMTCDPGALSQILINLMENSLVHGFPEEFTPDIPASEGPWKPVIFIAAEAVGDNIEIEYRDNGIGMSVEAREKLFEKMYTTRKAQGGTGYGMMMIHDIVHNRLGGEIRFIHTDESGQTGVNFIITLSQEKD